MELILNVKSASLSFLLTKIGFFALDLSSYKGSERFHKMTEFQGIISQKAGIADVAKQPWLKNLSDNTDLRFLKVIRKYIFAATKSRERSFPLVFPTATILDAGSC